MDSLSIHGGGDVGSEGEKATECREEPPLNARGRALERTEKRVLEAEKTVFLCSSHDDE